MYSDFCAISLLGTEGPQIEFLLSQQWPALSSMAVLPASRKQEGTLVEPFFSKKNHRDLFFPSLFYLRIILQVGRD
jgi:hypothetical protein